jgi:hypothetical protein
VPLTALDRAKLVKQEEEFLILKENMLNSYQGLETIRKNASTVFSVIARLCEEVATAGVGVRVGFDQRHCVITNNQVSLTVVWYQRIANSTKDAFLHVTQYGGQVALPGERLMHFGDGPNRRREFRFSADLSRAREYCWVDPRGSNQFLDNAAMSDVCVSLFLEQVDRWNREERPSLSR